MLRTRKVNESHLDHIEEAYDSLASDRQKMIPKYVNLNPKK